jgi:hypothetical protein
MQFTDKIDCFKDFSVNELFLLTFVSNFIVNLIVLPKKSRGFDKNF